MKNKNPYVEVVKILIIILIPLVFIEFVVYSNIKSNEFNYFYDVGNNNDNYLSPAERISDKINTSDINYRNLISQLVYFDIPIIKNVNEINVSIRFKDDFPDNTRFSLGAKDKEEWHYFENLIYDKTVEKLMQKYEYQTQDSLILLKLNKFVKDYTINDFLTNPPSVKLATNQNITIPEFYILNYESKQTEIATPLRGSLMFYIYAKDTLTGSIEKRDLNMYNKTDKGEDTLEINLYNLKGDLLYNEIIPDDGIKGKLTNKSSENEQKLSFSVYGLNEEVYKLVLKNNGDMLITGIKLNSAKIILQSQFSPSGSTAYFNDIEDNSRIYFKISKPISLSAQTYHKEGANQTIKIINNYGGFNDKIKIKEHNTKYGIIIPPSDNFYKIETEKGDITIKGPEFFAFSEDSWFDPFQAKNVVFKSDIAYLEKNADYVLVEYTPTQNKGEWKIVSTSFNVEKDNLYIRDNKLNMVLDVPHLNSNQNRTNQMQIPIDWINITVHKKGFFEK